MQYFGASLQEVLCRTVVKLKRDITHFFNVLNGFCVAWLRSLQRVCLGTQSHCCIFTMPLFGNSKPQQITEFLHPVGMCTKTSRNARMHFRQRLVSLMLEAKKLVCYILPKFSFALFNFLNLPNVTKPKNKFPAIVKP